jgi:acetylornithine deacetylase/succinyl-diaminopimelate desuccinylase-like protein
MVAVVNQVGWNHAPDAVATVGLIESRPNSRNVVPGSVFFTIDLRHPSDDVVAAMEAAARQRLEQSHNEAEHAEKSDVIAGANVLLRAVLETDQRLAERAGRAA